MPTLTAKTVARLVSKHGEEVAKKALLAHFENEDNLVDWAVCFEGQISLPLPDHQHEILDTVPKVDRLVVAAPRGSGKSTTVNILVLAYYALFKKSNFSVLISDTTPQSRLQLDALKSELESNAFVKWLFGDVVGETWGADFIEVKTQYGDSAIMARSAGQKIRGLKWRRYRPELVVIDDLENDEAVQSAERRMKLEDWFKRSLLSGLSKDFNKVVFLGTVLHEEAIVKKIVEGREGFSGWARLFYKAIKDNGKSYWQQRFPVEYLTEIRDNPQHPEYIGSLAFLTEYQNEPRSIQDRITQPSWITYYSKSNFEEDWIDSLKYIYAAIDPAISEKSGSSWFVVQTIGVDKDGHKWHLDTIRGKHSVLQQIQIVLDSYERWKHDLIGIESIAYQRVLSQLLRAESAKRGLYPKVKELYTDKSKSRRMEKASAQFEGGFVHLDRNHSETSNLVEEILKFPAEPNDSADALLLALELSTKKRARAFTSKPAGF